MQPEVIQTLEGQVRAFSPNAQETREIEFVISTPGRDRHRTRTNPRNWKLDNYARNGIVGYQHNIYGDMCNPPNPDDVIGSGRAFTEGDNLIGVVRFEPADLNPLADKIFRKVLAGTLRATSVGFMPIPDPQTNEYGKWGEGEEAQGRSNETFYFYGQELLEFSIVNIPYIRRATGLDFQEIETLTIRDVLDALEGKFGNLDQIRSALEARKTPPTPVVDAGVRDLQAIANAVRRGAVNAAIKASMPKEL
jgi:hypothetical protein